MTVAEVVKLLGVDAARGLTSAEAKLRLERDGENILEKGKSISAMQLFLEQFKDILIVILLIATGVSAFLGHENEAIAIAVIVAFAVTLGFVQEYRAERAIESLQKMAAPHANALRDGEERKIPAAEIVAGDVIVLHAGDRVPADARILSSANLHTDEASLTGESVPVGKIDKPIIDPRASVGDRKNMVYAGTSATYGRATAIVTSTGMRTELGSIAGMLQTMENKQTPLQQNLDKVGKTLAKAGFGIVLLIMLLGYLRGQGLIEMLIFGIALAVAVVPEALPAVVTISLAIGVQRMVKRHALVRRLPAVEALGSVTTICTDKTGTLTKDEMTIRSIICDKHAYDVTGAGYEPHGTFLLDEKIIDDVPDTLRQLLLGGMLSSDARLTKHESGWEAIGDPTEAAIVVAAEKAGLHRDRIDAKYKRFAEIPFTSETKRMTTLHESEEGTVAFAKGAPEILLHACVSELTATGIVELSDERRDEILADAETLAGRALRVLAVSMKKNVAVETAEQEMTFLGLVGMIDPPRPEATEAVKTCAAAGIRVVMITGDHPVTAQAIAKEIGILKGGKVVTGIELETMTQERLEAEVKSIDVFARVSPEHKLKVVAALQKHGDIVAMTGDGVNDAPALKNADIGVAMGITGTDVSKEAAAIVLTDDNFASIVAAVEEGRGIFGNIKKYLMYLLSANIGEICIMTLASALGLPLPLSAVQILYVNLATDGLPALALAFDPPEPNIMKRPPRDPRQSIFTRRVVTLMLTGGLWSTAVNLGVFLWALQNHATTEEAMAMTFMSLTLIEFFKAYVFRSDRESTFFRTFTNRWLNIFVAGEFLILLAIVYTPALQNVIGTFALTLTDWIVVGTAAFSIIPVMEIAKMIVGRQASATASA